MCTQEQRELQQKMFGTMRPIPREEYMQIYQSTGDRLPLYKPLRYYLIHFCNIICDLVGNTLNSEYRIWFQSAFQEQTNLYKLGMGRYQKCVRREVVKAKPYRFRDSAF